MNRIVVMCLFHSVCCYEQRESHQIVDFLELVKAVSSKLNFKLNYKLWARGSITHVEMTQKKISAPMYTAILSPGNKCMVASKSTYTSLCTLPQSTVALRLSRHYSEVAYLKTVKIQNRPFYVKSERIH